MFHVEVDGANKTGSISIPNTGSPDAYQLMSVENISLEAGQHVMTVVIDSGGANLDYFLWSLSRPCNPSQTQQTARSQYDFWGGLLVGFRDRNSIVTQTIYNDPFDRPTQVKQALSTAAEARAHVIGGPGNPWGIMDGPYSLGFDYDVWGNMTRRYGWGGEVQGPSDSSIPYYYSNGRNQRDSFAYDAAGNVTNDGMQSLAYDATGQQTYASGFSSSGSAPTFTNDPLNPNGTKTEIKLVHLTELRSAVNQLRVRAGLAQVTNWNPDPNPQQYVTPVHHDHITQLRTKLEEALNALHLPIGGYAHSGPNQGDTIYAVDFQELRNKIKAAWTALASSGLSQSYDGDGLRVKKTEYGATTYYVRSSVLGGQVIAELDAGGNWARGYVYAGSGLMAVQQGGVFWMHEDPVTKSKRTTDVNGNVVSAIELDPWGADTNRSGNPAFQPRKYTTYDRDGNGSDEAMFRRYNRKNSRFEQPDPYEGSYDLSSPQSFNRYAYTQNDPVNFVDPTGLETCYTDIDGKRVCIPDITGTVTIYSGSSGGSSVTGILGGDTGIRIVEDTPGGGEQGGGGGPQNYVPPTIRNLKDSFYKKYRADIDRCIKEVFGNDYAAHFGNKRHETTANSPVINLSQNSKQLGRMTGVPAANGAPDGRVRPNGMIYIAKDAWRDPNNALGVGDELYRDYAHELGNVLSYKISLDYNAYGDPKGIGTTYLDKDTGAKFEKCMFGNVNF